MEIMDKFKEADFALLAFDVDQKKEDAVKFVNDNSYEFTEWVYDAGSGVFGNYKQYNENSGGIPQTVIIDRDGNVRFAFLGAIKDASVFTDVIEDLL